MCPRHRAGATIDAARQIAERSGDDFALGHARYALGLALMHRDSQQIVSAD